MTPPDALPYSPLETPRITSIVPMEDNGMWSNCVCPSGVVTGMPSHKTLIPRMPKVARVPNPRMEMRVS